MLGDGVGKLNDKMPKVVIDHFVESAINHNVESQSLCQKSLRWKHDQNSKTIYWFFGFSPVKLGKKKCHR